MKENKDTLPKYGIFAEDNEQPYHTFCNLQDAIRVCLNKIAKLGGI